MGYDSSVRSTSERAETLIGMVGTPIKPHLPAVSRFLIVATFYEDALRILWQWSDQVMYLEQARYFPKYAAPAFLGFNAIVSWHISLNLYVCDHHINYSSPYSPCYSLLLVLY